MRSLFALVFELSRSILDFNRIGGGAIVVDKSKSASQLIAVFVPISESWVYFRIQRENVNRDQCGDFVRLIDRLVKRGELLGL
ncbi:MAG: hypothetical protein NT013_04845 [Planctomycetia bacterium]|nr:hypothetical protein [Planctomycetia bacterium]